MKINFEQRESKYSFMSAYPCSTGLTGLQCCLHEFRVTTGNRYMRFYVNPSNLLFFIARLSTSTNTTEEFKGYLNYVVNDDRCNNISNFHRKSFQEIYPLLHHLKCFLVTARYVLERASMENLERCW